MVIIDLLLINLFMDIFLLCLKNLNQVIKLISHKVIKFKVGDRVRINKHESSFSKGHTEKWSKEIFVISSVLKTNPWMHKIKDLNREKIRRSFHEKELLLSKLWMSFYPEPDSHVSIVRILPFPMGDGGMEPFFRRFI